jgi:phospholipid-transporting ATPase
VYFLAIAVLQVIPDITISDGIPNILLPLFLVIFVTAIKDIAEDLKRRRSDTEENTRLVCARVGGEWANK